MHFVATKLVRTLTFAAALSACAGSDDHGGRDAAKGDHWIGAWGTAQYGPFPLGPLTGTLPVDPLPPAVGQNQPVLVGHGSGVRIPDASWPMPEGRLALPQYVARPPLIS